MTGRRLALPALLLGLALAAGCGGEDGGDNGSTSGQDSGDTPSATPTGEAAGGAEACDLLSQAEVSKSVGVKVGPGQSSSSPVVTGGTQTTCEWRSVDKPADTAKLTIYSERSAADSVRESDPDAEPLRGVGDKAFVSSFASVWFYVGDRSAFAQWYSILADDEENLPKSEALAKAAAAKM